MKDTGLSFRIPKKKPYIPPCTQNYTIYSISGCKYCSGAKQLLLDKKKACKMVNCDKYVATALERDAFYKFIQQHTVKPYIHFPMIFKKGKFIGGYKELIDTLEKK